MLALPTPTAADVVIVIVHGAPVCLAPTPVWAYTLAPGLTIALQVVCRERRTLATMLLDAPEVEPEPSTGGWSSDDDFWAQ